MLPAQKVVLDALFKRVIMVIAGAAVFVENGKERWYGRCQRCMKERWLQVSHHHPKGRKPWLRWDEDNAAAFCVGCHLFWWHRYPAEAVAWLMKYLGPKRYEALGIRAGTRRSEPDFYLLQLALTKRYGELTRAA